VDKVTAIADGTLRVEISTRGAELQSLRRADAEVEYLWQGDPALWGRRAPILFPIVGRLRGDRYLVAGREYRLPQHGFARERLFSLHDETDTAVTMELCESEETRAHYPFAFRLAVSYALRATSLVQRLEVANPNDRPLPFSVGLHPAFRCPLLADESLEDYSIEFEVAETADRYPVVDGLVARHGEPCLRSQSSLPLRPELFQRGAVVFRELQSRRVRLVGPGGLGVEIAFADFPYFAIWSKPGAAFVCLEPWCGIADPPDASGHIEDKEGIVLLPSGATFAREMLISPL